MRLTNHALRVGMTLAAASLGAGATVAAGALILGLGTHPASARQTDVPAAVTTMPPVDGGLPASNM